MEQALVATQLIFYLLGGLGIFFPGISVFTHKSLLYGMKLQGLNLRLPSYF